MRLKVVGQDSMKGVGGSRKWVCNMHLRHRGFCHWTKDG
jgi:hypothetical protein